MRPYPFSPKNAAKTDLFTNEKLGGITIKNKAQSLSVFSFLK